MRALAAAAIALAATSATAQELPRGDLRYTPDPAWYRGNLLFLPGDGGRVRVVTAPQGTAALTLEQFYAYERVHRAALARLSFRMPVARAEPLARGEALAAVLARYPTTRVAAIPTGEIAGPDLPVGRLR